MTLPASARRVTIVVMRPAAATPAAEDDWGRRTRAADEDAPDDPPEHLRTRGDLQPRAVRGGSGETVAAGGGGVSLSTHVAFTDVLDIRAGDMLRLEPDDGLRYPVTRIDRPGIGRRLDHLEVGCDLVTSGAAARV